jgi:cytochrome oxidase Cu insertion factor (SCO1/SenC/PrrC family)
MNCFKNLMLSSAFALGALALSSHDAQAQKVAREGDPRIKTENLAGLKDMAGRPFDMDKLKGKFLLVYFGTAYANPSCDSFFDNAGLSIRLLKEKCGLQGKDFQAVFVCPYTKGETNQRSIDNARRNGFEILRGDLNTVKDIAGKFRSQYFGNDGQGNPAKHTNVMLLQNKDGVNSFILLGDHFPAEIMPHFTREMKEDGLQLKCQY